MEDSALQIGSPSRQYNKCIRVLLKDKNRILYKLDQYSKIWDSFLDEKSKEFQEQECIDYIKKQSNKIINKIDKSIQDYYNDLDDNSQEQIKNIVSEIKSHLGKVVLNIIVNIKSKVAEIDVFKNQIDIRKLLSEDKYILKEREKKKILDNITNILQEHKPTLVFLDSTDVSGYSLDEYYVFINNSLYYTKKSIKDINNLVDVICKCDIPFIYPIEKISQIENHLRFLRTKFTTSHSKQLFVNYILDNILSYHSFLLFLQELYTQITLLFSFGGRLID